MVRYSVILFCRFFAASRFAGLMFSDARVGLVDGHDIDVDVGAEHLSRRCVLRQRVEAGERIRRDR